MAFFWFHLENHGSPRGICDQSTLTDIEDREACDWAY